VTHESKEIIIGADERLGEWLLERFGVDVSKIWIGDRLVFTVSKSGPLMMRVEFFVGDDDLRAFPEAE
jgi:hypothetical protein